MSKQDNKPPEKKSTAAPPAAPKGRVVHDQRGNATWELDILTGKFKSTRSQVLKKLDTSGLEMADEGALRFNPTGPSAGAVSGSGYDPYNQVSSKKLVKSGAKAPSPPGKPKGRP